ncbi:unnamed protein product, partial [Mesorhabditis spiculigera]
MRLVLVILLAHSVSTSYSDNCTLFDLHLDEDGSDIILEQLIPDCQKRNELNGEYAKAVAQGNFYCGTDEKMLLTWTTHVARALMWASCGSIKDRFNRICFIHDVCYEARSPETAAEQKRHCDDSFCDLMSTAVSHAHWWQKPTCWLVQKTFCAAVKAIPYDRLPSLAHYIMERRKIKAKPL